MDIHRGCITSLHWIHAVKTQAVSFNQHTILCLSTTLFSQGNLYDKCTIKKSSVAL